MAWEVQMGFRCCLNDDLLQGLGWMEFDPAKLLGLEGYYLRAVADCRRAARLDAQSSDLDLHALRHQLIGLVSDCHHVVCDYSVRT